MGMVLCAGGCVGYSPSHNRIENSSEGERLARPQGDNGGPRWAGDCVWRQDHVVPDGAGRTEKRNKLGGKGHDGEGLGSRSNRHSRAAGKLRRTGR